MSIVLTVLQAVAVMFSDLTALHTVHQLLRKCVSVLRETSLLLHTLTQTGWCLVVRPSVALSQLVSGKHF